MKKLLWFTITAKNIQTVIEFSSSDLKDDLPNGNGTYLAATTDKITTEERGSDGKAVEKTQLPVKETRLQRDLRLLVSAN